MKVLQFFESFTAVELDISDYSESGDKVVDRIGECFDFLSAKCLNRFSRGFLFVYNGLFCFLGDGLGVAVDALCGI